MREAGAFTGVLMLNMVLTLGLMFLVFMGYVLWRGVTGDDVSIWPFAGVALVIAVALPILGYSFAWSTWVAIDLATRPLDPDEELEALDHEHAEPGGWPGAQRSGRDLARRGGPTVVHRLGSPESTQKSQGHPLAPHRPHGSRWPHGLRGDAE